MSLSASPEPLRLTLKDNHRTELPTRGGIRAVHVFDEGSIDAVNAALAAGRPLLLRGEPGTGKSQLAYAVAKELELPLVSTVIDSRTEARDLLYRFDAVARLAAAQVAGAFKLELADLAEACFVMPGPLWWAYDWNGAASQQALYERRGSKQSSSESSATRKLVPEAMPERPQGWQPGYGAVVLIDEIDKADPDLPNGLLEALGDGRFTPLGAPRVELAGTPPLVLITSNEERALPDAFVRRCLVLELALPSARDAFIVHLARRIGPAHFPSVEADVLVKAAELLDDDRRTARSRGWPLPGQAEYLDLVRAVTRGPRVGDVKSQLDALERLSRFTYKKQPSESSSAERKS